MDTTHLRHRETRRWYILGRRKDSALWEFVQGDALTKGQADRELDHLRRVPALHAVYADLRKAYIEGLEDELLN